MTNPTPAQRTLLDLEILLSSLDLDHPDIVEGWVAKIAAGLDTLAAINQTISVDIAQEMLEEICRLCRRLNPQHAECNWCNGTAAWRLTIKGATQHTTPATPRLLEVLSEFVQDIEAVGTVHVQLQWPDLAITYHKARAAIAKAKDAAKPAIRTQAQLMQEWGQERFVTALSALANWRLRIPHSHPYSIQEIRALADANDDAFHLFSARLLYPTA